MEIPYNVQPREDTGLYNAKVGIWLFLASEVMLFGALFSAYILLRVGAPPETWPHGLLNITLGTINTLVLICSSVTVVMAWASLKMNRLKHFKIYQTLTVTFALVFLVIKTFEYKDKFTHYAVHIKEEKLSSYQSYLHGATNVLDGHLIERTTNYIKLHLSEGHKRQPASVRQHPSGAAAGAEHGTSVQTTAAGGEHGHAEVTVPIEDIALRSNGLPHFESYGPWHNTYMAIYFTLTGLHGLHVLGGALVIGYLLGPGIRMWKTEPERFTNRIEVSGLFWHFVDLVWIFLFPVLYLL